VQRADPLEQPLVLLPPLVLAPALQLLAPLP
jgi:hypothetical protein